MDDRCSLPINCHDSLTGIGHTAADYSDQTVELDQPSLRDFGLSHASQVTKLRTGSAFPTVDNRSRDGPSSYEICKSIIIQSPPGGIPLPLRLHQPSLHDDIQFFCDRTAAALVCLHDQSNPFRGLLQLAVPKTATRLRKALVALVRLHRSQTQQKQPPDSVYQLAQSAFDDLRVSLPTRNEDCDDANLATALILSTFETNSDGRLRLGPQLEAVLNIIIPRYRCRHLTPQVAFLLRWYLRLMVIVTSHVEPFGNTHATMIVERIFDSQKMSVSSSEIDKTMGFCPEILTLILRICAARDERRKADAVTEALKLRIDAIEHDVERLTRSLDAAQPVIASQAQLLACNRAFIGTVRLFFQRFISLSPDPDQIQQTVEDIVNAIVSVPVTVGGGGVLHFMLLYPLWHAGVHVKTSSRSRQTILNRLLDMERHGVARSVKRSLCNLWMTR